MGAWIAREYGEEAAQEYEERFVITEGGYGAPHQEDLPQNLNFNAGVEFLNQLITYERVIYWG
jgi:hypothetical protein